MKKSLLVFLLIASNSVQALEPQGDCQPPGQGFLESKVKDVFQGQLGETELKEWMMHPKNSEVRQTLRELDRRTKFSRQRLQREELLSEAQVNFDQAIANTERPSDMDHFPLPNSHSKVSGSKGALTLEMTNLPKDELDVLPPEILSKLEPKVKINYFFPYDKFEYHLTYEGKELPMMKALLLVQRDMEDACEKRQVENGEYRRWYDKRYIKDINIGKPGSIGSGGGSSSQQ